jgi:hypothetical protein
VDFGEQHGKVIDDAVQFEVRVNGEVVKETKVNSTAAAEREADRIVSTISGNAKNLGKLSDTDTISAHGKEVGVEIYHDGFGGFHGQLNVTDSDGLTHYMDDGPISLDEPDFMSKPKAGEFKNEAQAKRVLQKRAEKLAKLIASRDAKDAKAKAAEESAAKTDDYDDT